MKIVAIGDTHGRDKWKKMVEKEMDADKIIFIGDYFDSFHIPLPEQIKNFLDIIRFKLDNPDKVILLLGNHDFHYISEMGERYSGYNSEYAEQIENIIQYAIRYNLIQICWLWKEFLFSHAGVTETWLKDSGYEEGAYVVDHVNKTFINSPHWFKFRAGKNNSMYGDDITQPPIWVRPESLKSDSLHRIIQVVGHTTQQKIVINTINKLILIDCIDNSGEYLIIKEDDNKVVSAYAEKIAKT